MDETVDSYSAASRALQDNFDTRRLADRLHDMFRSRWTLEEARTLIEAAPMFFLATADAQGRPQCSYKGGAPGFVHILGPMELAYPSYDGNGMYLSTGNIAENPAIQMLFIDFASPNRMRVSGHATLSDDPALLARWPGAELAVHVAVDAVFPNCGRYIHRTGDAEISVNVPDHNGSAPIAEWKKMPLFQDVLAARDPARAVADE
jgi:predicted pyridoxine 5'-phosphate oxidase superfamily flavin-nucleotide-binding protein